MPILSHADLKLNYQLLGPPPDPARPPVALIHGLGANLSFWYLGAMRHLGRDRSFLLHDLRGHGASSMPRAGYRLEHMAEDFRRLLDNLNIPRVHVVGHSHGARVGLVFSQLYPDRVESLTVADTQLRALQAPMRLGEWPHWPRWKADLEARGVTQFPPEEAPIDFRLLAELGHRAAGGRVPSAAEDGTLRRRAADLLAAKPGKAAVPVSPGRAQRRGRIDMQSRQMGVRGASQWQALMETTRASEEMHDETRLVPAELGRLKMPVLLLYGQLSHCTPTADRLLEILPNARRILVPEAGHFFPVVKPRPFARTLNMFLDRGDVEAGRQPSARAKMWQPNPRAAVLQRQAEILPPLRKGPGPMPGGLRAGGLALRLANRARRSGPE